MSLTRLLASFGLLIAVASRSPLEAQPLDRSGAGALTGTLVSADTVAVAVRTEEGTIVAFTVENPASVPAGLLPGTRVTVRYDVPEPNRYVVVRVGVASYPPEPGSSTAVRVPAAEPPPTTAPTPSPPSAQESSAAVGRAPASVRPAARRVVGLPGLERSQPRAAPVPPLAPPTEPPMPRAATDRQPETSAGDLLKLGGGLLAAGGLIALALAALRTLA
jgi:hypothetical protein